MDLTTLSAQVLTLLGDPDGVRYTADMLAEAARMTLREYGSAVPNNGRLIHTVSSAGSFQEPAGLPPVAVVMEVNYPYDPSNTFQPEVQDYDLIWVEGKWQLILGLQFFPEVGEQMRIWWSGAHTLKELDGAAATSTNPLDDALLALGAAGHTSLMRAAQVLESPVRRPQDAVNLAAQGKDWLREFRLGLGRRASCFLNPLPHCGWPVP